MSLGLRIRTISLGLGTNLDYFFPNYDMPDEVNERGYEAFEDVYTTPNGNAYIYGKGRIKTWDLHFRDVTSRTKDFLEHMASGWLTEQQISVIFFGSHVTGTTQSPGTYTASQIWGTAYIRISKPKETAYDLWDIDANIREFGPDQSFS